MRKVSAKLAEKNASAERALFNFMASNPDGHKKVARWFASAMPYSKIRQACDHFGIKY